MKEINCSKCGKMFSPIKWAHKKCGSVRNKRGCSWEDFKAMKYASNKAYKERVGYYKKYYHRIKEEKQIVDGSLGELLGQAL